VKPRPISLNLGGKKTRIFNSSAVEKGKSETGTKQNQAICKCDLAAMYVSKVSKLIGFNLIKAGNGLMKRVLT